MSDQTDLFWSRVDVTGCCWLWTGGTNGRGYGQMQFEFQVQMAHRIAYQLLVGEIEDGMVLDHLCRNKLCVNPDHLEPVTQSTNLLRAFRTKPMRRKSHCKYGHEFTEENTYMHTNRRHCRTCRADRKVKARV